MKIESLEEATMVKALTVEFCKKCHIVLTCPVTLIDN